MNDSFNQINNETVFTNSTLSLSDNDDDLVSDKVNILANGIYQEFENLIKLYGQGTVDGLMPLVVTILETMDKLYTCKDDLSLQLDLIREDQSQLYTQYEREKLSKKLAEEKINRIEDQFEEERQQFENRIELLESNCKVGEMKIKNCRDLIMRHEEKESDMRKEFNTLQQRYSELLRTKAEHKHRNTHNQCPTEEISSGGQSPQLVRQKVDKISKNTISVIHRLEVGNLTDEIIDPTMGKFSRDQINVMNELSLKDELDLGTNNQKSEYIQDSLLSDEHLVNDENFESISQVDNDVNAEQDDLCIENYFDDLGMSNEIEFLIRENQDLIETKNALNVVKDDLITKLDELTGQLCLAHETFRNADNQKKKYRALSQDLEKRLNEVTQQLKEKEAKLSELGEDENLIECAVNQNGVQTKTKFTRAEVSRILLERNKYKEELLELQETIRYQTAVKSQKTERAKKGTMWNLFSSVLSNATAFTTEAIIGSGNEMTVTQLNKNFTSYNKDLMTIIDDTGGIITFPNLTNHANSHNKRSTPGLPVRVSNPLYSPLHDPTTVDLIPLDEIERKSTKHNAIDNSSV